MRILVVDDSEDWRDLTEAALMAAGYEQVTTAESATEAFNVLGVGPRPGNGAAAVDLIVLDLVMPEIDGIEACARIRGDARYIDVPVIMVTAASDMDSLSSLSQAADKPGLRPHPAMVAARRRLHHLRGPQRLAGEWRHHRRLVPV